MLRKKIYIIFLLVLALLSHITAQDSPMPTSESGTNSIVYNSAKQEYYFFYNSDTLYKYNVTAGNTSNTGGNFHAIQAKSANGNWFYPSVYGGITAELDGESKRPWDSDVTFSRLRNLLSDDKVKTAWKMKYNDVYIRYHFSLMITGKTLVIEVTTSAGDFEDAQITLDRCENAEDARIVRIPYLTLFNVLYSDGGYTSLFNDWETTNCSKIITWPEPSTIRYSSTSVRYAPIIKYFETIDGEQNSLKETIYLTVSDNLDEVLPNVVPNPTPSANYDTYRKRSANRTVLTFGQPYTYLYKPLCDYTVGTIDDCLEGVNKNYKQYATGNALHTYWGTEYYKLLHLLKNMGIEGLSVLAKYYQNKGYDRGYPVVLPANAFTNSCKLGTEVSNDTLRKLSQEIQSLGYDFALHENYVDLYESSDKLEEDEDNISKDADGNMRRNWVNDDGETSYVIKPSEASGYVDIYTTEIADSIGPNWSYLDVHSAASAGPVEDFSTLDGIKLTNVLENYRALPEKISDIYGGPVEGEGGKNHTFLYVGYFHDLEARLHTADDSVYGYKCPLFVDFDLQKLHTKSAFHGVGVPYRFYASDPDTKGPEVMDIDEVKKYIAYELAFGHSGYIRKQNTVDHTIYQADLEYNYVYPIQQLYADADVTSILYFHNSSGSGKTASEYIEDYPDYWDATSSDFMSRVKVTYDNGLVVYVNINGNSWTVTHLSSGKYYYNLAASGLGISNTSDGCYGLAANNGWLVYVPTSLLKSSAGLSLEELPYKLSLSNNYPNPFNPTTTITFTLPEEDNIKLIVYDILGREVTKLADGAYEAGEHELNFNASHLASGVYIFRLQTSTKALTKKMMLLK